MKFKNLTFILAVLLIAAVALGSVSAAEDIADDSLAIDDVAEVDEASPVEELVTESVAEELEDDATTATYQVDKDNWTNFDFTQGNVIVDFENETYTDFNIAGLGDYTTLNGNGATVIGNGNRVFDISNTVGVTITGFNIIVGDSTKDGIGGNYVYNATITNNNICDGNDGINIYRSWDNLVISGNTITNMSRDGISLANPDSTYYNDFGNFNGAAISYNNIGSFNPDAVNETYGIFIGGTFKGSINYNTISGADYGMEFAGKPVGTYGKLNVEILGNTISNVDVGINMCHPDVIRLLLGSNTITANNYSIKTNSSYGKDSYGSIHLYYNELNGAIASDFINDIDVAMGNNGTDAYNNAYGTNNVIPAKNLLQSSVLTDSDSNQFTNGEFDDGLNGWTLYYNDNHDDTSAEIQTDDEQGNYLYLPYIQGISDYIISYDGINYSTISEIRFKYKCTLLGGTNFYFRNENGDGMGGGTLKLSQTSSWTEITVPASTFEEYADGVSHKLTICMYVTFAMGSAGISLDSFETVPAESDSKTETSLTVSENGNNLIVSFKDAEGNAVAGDVNVYNGEELLDTLTFDGTATEMTIAKPDTKGTVTITAVYEETDEYLGASSEPLIYTAPYTGNDLQDLINDVEDGGVIDLGENCVYEIADGTTFTLDQKVTVKGNNVTIKASGASQGGSGALFTATKAGTSFEGITFINTDGHKAYGEEVSGYAITLSCENATVNNCKFIDWNSGIYGGGASFCNITDCYFNGSSWTVTGAGKGEKGTKAINLMGCHDLLIKGCTFDGQVLDGISSASNSANLVVIENTFIENIYAIFFGGASTQGCLIANNTFIRCGYCPDVSAEINEKIPVISTQKSANGYTIADNNVEALNGTTFIIAESGNTAHGYPSKIGDINITGNTLAVAEGATPETITLIKIISNQGELNPYAPINISGNTIAAGVTPVKVWYADWGSEDDPVIPAADPVVTSLEIVDVSTATKKVTVKLVDIGGEVLAGETISYSINGGAVKTAETDADGLAVIDATEDGTIAIAFAGNDEFKEAETSIQFTGTTTKTNPVITAGAMTATAKVGKYYSITLKDAAGNALVGEKVTFYYNGQNKTVTTDEKGIAKLNINLAAKGNYPITISYLGNDYNNAAVAVKNIKVNVQKTKAVFKKATLKVKKAKKVKFTLKDASGKAIKGKKITIKVNGKTFSAKTNAKGVASIKVKVAKKGKFTAKATFAGDNTYKKITKKAKFTVK